MAVILQVKTQAEGEAGEDERPQGASFRGGYCKEAPTAAEKGERAALWPQEVQLLFLWQHPKAHQGCRYNHNN
jgi:hypothetical protein